jgi:hypothetical protein
VRCVAVTTAVDSQYQPRGISAASFNQALSAANHHALTEH